MKLLDYICTSERKQLQLIRKDMKVRYDNFKMIFREDSQICKALMKLVQSENNTVKLHEFWKLKSNYFETNIIYPLNPFLGLVGFHIAHIQDIFKLEQTGDRTFNDLRTIITSFRLVIYAKDMVGDLVYTRVILIFLFV